MRRQRYGWSSNSGSNNMIMFQRRCPITYEQIEGNAHYSLAGLKKLSPRLNKLYDINFSATELLQEAAARASKMSIQGVQSKISATINFKTQSFELVTQDGNFILKPQSPFFPEFPQNEDLTMRLAALAGIDVPLHGMVYAKDGSLVYFIKRFDRLKKKKKMAVEDFAQLGGYDRDSKYESSMEKATDIIENFCTFPFLEKQKLLQLTLFNYLIGNEDMHLKNFSLLYDMNKVELSPAYNLLNTTIILPNTAEELALSLNGKKNNMKGKDFFQYFAQEKLQLPEKLINSMIENFKSILPIWQDVIKISFLSPFLQEKYLALLDERAKIF